MISGEDILAYFNVFVLGLTVFACSGFVWVYSCSKGDACQLCGCFQYGADLRYKRPVTCLIGLVDVIVPIKK
jgi:hypothetical protein